MAKFSVSLDQEGNLESAFGRVWQRHTVELIEGDDILHPLRAVALGTTKFSNAFNAAVDALIGSDLYDDDTEGSTSPVLKAFEDVCYKATEVFDVFSIAIPKAINLKPTPSHRKSANDYVETVRKRRDDWALICNKIKHNGNMLVPVRQRSVADGKTIRGFALYQPTSPDQLTLNKSLHKGERSRPFDIALNQLAHDVMKCELAAANQLLSLPKLEASAHPSGIPVYRIGQSIKILFERVVFAGDAQSTMFDGVILDESGAHFQRMKAEPLKGQKEISVVFTADGFTKLFEMS